MQAQISSRAAYRLDHGVTVAVIEDRSMVNAADVEALGKAIREKLSECQGGMVIVCSRLASRVTLRRGDMTPARMKITLVVRRIGNPSYGTRSPWDDLPCRVTNVSRRHARYNRGN